MVNITFPLYFFTKTLGSKFDELHGNAFSEHFRLVFCSSMPSYKLSVSVKLCSNSVYFYSDFHLGVDVKRPKPSKKDNSSSKLYLIIFCSLVCGLIGFAAYKNSSLIAKYMLNQNEKQTEQSSDKPTVKPIQKPPLKKDKKANTEDDSYASITNDYDKKISKELGKAQKLLDQKRLKDALIKFESLVSRYRDSPRAIYGKAQTLDKIADAEQSNEYLGKAIDAYAQVPDVKECPNELKKLALRRKAERETFFGRLRQAIATLQRLSGYFPGDTGILNELGVSYLMTGMNKDGQRIFEQV